MEKNSGGAVCHGAERLSMGCNQTGRLQAVWAACPTNACPNYFAAEDLAPKLGRSSHSKLIYFFWWWGFPTAATCSPTEWAQVKEFWYPQTTDIVAMFTCKWGPIWLDPYLCGDVSRPMLPYIFWGSTSRIFLRHWRNPARWDSEPCICALFLQIKNINIKNSQLMWYEFTRGFHRFWPIVIPHLFFW